jgi:hypothetical protein
VCAAFFLCAGAAAEGTIRTVSDDCSVNDESVRDYIEMIFVFNDWINEKEVIGCLLKGFYLK